MNDERGVAGRPVDELAGRVLGAWDALLALAEQSGPEQSLAELAELGSWPERPVLHRLMHQARTAAPPAPGSPPVTTTANRTGESDGAADRPGHAGATAERMGTEGRVDHGGAGRDAVLAALGEARARVAGALEEIRERPALALVPLDSALGPLPLLTQVHAMGHELALAALRWTDARTDTRPEAVPLPEAITDAGVAALIDVVGALAHRQGLRASAGVWGPGTDGWIFLAGPEGWRTVQGASAASGVPGVEGPAAAVLGVPAGRGALPSLLARGELKLHRIGGLMALAPLLEQVPGLPGGVLLRRAAGMVGLLGRLPGMR